MIAVIFEVTVAQGQRERYLQLAAELKPLLADIDGFISVERFDSLSRADTLLSLSFWRDEEAARAWRQLQTHHATQKEGRAGVFDDYRLRVAEVLRDYGMTSRDAAPEDSRIEHG